MAYAVFNVIYLYSTVVSEYLHLAERKCYNVRSGQGRRSNSDPLVTAREKARGTLDGGKGGGSGQ